MLYAVAVGQIIIILLTNCLSYVVFNMCLYCGYLPKHLICSSFVPIVKNKAGDLTDVNIER